MSLDPLTAGIDLAKAAITRIWPDKTEQEKTQLATMVTMVQGQMNVNQAEAANPSVFVSGWRPFIGWVCGSACAWNWIGLSVGKFVLSFTVYQTNLAPASLTEMMPILMGMLGLGALRTYEKTQGVARV